VACGDAVMDGGGGAKIETAANRTTGATARSFPIISTSAQRFFAHCARMFSAISEGQGAGGDSRTTRTPPFIGSAGRPGSGGSKGARGTETNCAIWAVESTESQA